MSQDAQFADALRQSPVCVFKLWLMPYSLRHEGLLLGERNPFLLESPSAFEKLPLEQKINAIDRATKICSNFGIKWRDKFSRVDSRLSNLTEDKLDDAIDAFWNYINASRTAPRLSRRRVKSGEEPGRAFGAPLLAQLHPFVMTLPEIQKLSSTTTIISLAGIKKSTSSQEMINAAWDYPFGAAVWRYFTKLETEGCVQIENDDEEKSRIESANQRNEYETVCAAWKNAATDAEKTAAIEKHPTLRELAATEDEVRQFEAKGGVK